MTAEKYFLKSLMSIQADSSVVEAWVVSKNDMGYLSDKLLKDAFVKVIKLNEPDRPMGELDMEFLVDAFLNWDDYKTEYAARFIKK